MSYPNSLQRKKISYFGYELFSGRSHPAHRPGTPSKQSFALPVTWENHDNDPWNHRSPHLTCSPETPLTSSLSTFRSKGLLFLNIIFLLNPTLLQTENNHTSQSLQRETRETEVCWVSSHGSFSSCLSLDARGWSFVKECCGGNFCKHYLCFLFHQFVKCLFNFKSFVWRLGLFVIGL